MSQAECRSSSPVEWPRRTAASASLSYSDRPLGEPVTLGELLALEEPGLERLGELVHLGELQLVHSGECLSLGELTSQSV